MVLRMPSGVLARYPFSGALGLGTFWAGPLTSALRYSPWLAPLFELLLVAALPEAVDPSPAVVMSCGTQAASRVLRLMRVPPVSIERRFSMLGFMIGPPHRCSAWSPAYLHYARARTYTLRSHMCFEKLLLWWLFETHVAFRRNSGHTKGGTASTPLRVENGAPFQHAESTRRVNTPSQRAGKHNAPACNPFSGERGAASPGHG